MTNLFTALLVSLICQEVQSVSAVLVMRAHSVIHVQRATLVHHQVYAVDHVTVMATLILRSPAHVTEILGSV